jgi:hypothetical protein
MNPKHVQSTFVKASRYTRLNEDQMKQLLQYCDDYSMMPTRRQAAKFYKFGLSRMQLRRM